MLSPAVNAPNNSTFLPLLRRPPSPSPPSLISHKTIRKPISAALTPPPPSSSSQQQQRPYQPFRPPPSPLPSEFRSLDTASRLEILSNRLGPWFHYAPIIPSLFQEGFTPPSIEECTGISGVEQNRLVVAAQVRDSLVQSRADSETIAFFDSGGAELLYEIRLLSAAQRASAARYVVANRLDAKGAQELARAMKDFPRRRGDKARESFSHALPGDCVSFMRYRQSQEHPNPSPQRTAALESALSAAESETAKARIVAELQGDSDGKAGDEGSETGTAIRVPVVRLKYGEVAEAKSVVVLPLCRAEEEREIGLEEAPWECRTEGEFGVIVAEKGWRRWVVLPGWEPVAGLASGGGGGVAVSFVDARVLPWKANRWYKEEKIVVVANRGRKEVEDDDGFYLVGEKGVTGHGGLKVERGSALKRMGVKESLGTVMLVVRPPREETEDQLSDEDWE